MKKKICPICDAELKSGNFCPVCRKIVWQPRYESRNYNLNERRGDASPYPVKERPAGGERQYDDIAPGENPPQKTSEPVHRRPEIQGADPKGRQWEANQLPPSYGRRGPVYHPAEGRRRGGLPPSVIIATALTAVVIIGWIFAEPRVPYGTGDAGLLLELPDGGEGLDGGDSGGYQEYEVSEEEARAAEADCDWYLHSELTAGDAGEAIDSFLAELNGIEVRIEHYSDNRKYIYDDGHEENSFASGNRYYVIEANQGAGGEIDLNYDTSTGRVHYFYISGRDIDFVTSWATRLGEIMDDADSVKSITLEEMEEALRRLPAMDPEDYDDELWLYGDDWYLYGYPYDGMYSVWLEADVRVEEYAQAPAVGGRQ